MVKKEEDLLKKFLNTTNNKKVQWFIYKFNLLNDHKYNLSFNFAALQSGPFYLFYRKLYKEFFIRLILFFICVFNPLGIITSILYLIGISMYSNKLIFDKFIEYKNLKIYFLKNRKINENINNENNLNQLKKDENFIKKSVGVNNFAYLLGFIFLIIYSYYAYINTMKTLSTSIQDMENKYGIKLDQLDSNNPVLKLLKNFNQ